MYWPHLRKSGSKQAALHALGEPTTARHADEIKINLSTAFDKSGDPENDLIAQGNPGDGCFVRRTK